MPIFATALVVTAGVCAWLIPRTGLRGAAIGAAAGSLVQALGAAWALLAMPAFGPESSDFLPAG